MTAQGSLNRNTLGKSEDLELDDFMSGAIDYSGCGLPLEQYNLLEADYQMAWIGAFFSFVTFEQVDRVNDSYVDQVFTRVEKLPCYIRTYEIAYILYGDL